jgi:hypothetical protein
MKNASGKTGTKLWTLTCSAIVGCVILATCAAAGAQVAQKNAAGSALAVEVTAEDMAAARGIMELRYHITRAHTPAARGVPLSGPGELQVAPEIPQSELLAIAPNLSVLSAPGFYPADLSYFGGHTISVAQSHAVYLRCTTPATCWGNPEGFLTDLGKSSFIHIADPYVGAIANNRYTVGKSFTVTGTFPHVLGLNRDIAPILHAVAKQAGPGYAHIYHFFIPKGIDICSDPNNTQCYSPDKPSTWTFCGFHGNGTFPDIGHVVFTVEPYQNVPECGVQLPSPNGQLADSTNSLLSHEVFETITDPDDQSWFAVKSLNEHGFEIGDVCQPYVNKSLFFLVPTFLINGKKYEVQLEYSNKYHGCTNIP